MKRDAIPQLGPRKNPEAFRLAEKFRFLGASDRYLCRWCCQQSALAPTEIIRGGLVQHRLERSKQILSANGSFPTYSVKKVSLSEGRVIFFQSKVAM